MAKASIFIPIVATNIYKNTLPIVEAPAPSYFLNLVKERKSPPVVAITMSQKNGLVKLNFCKDGKLLSIYGVIISAPKCAKPVIPKQYPR